VSEVILRISIVFEFCVLHDYIIYNMYIIRKIQMQQKSTVTELYHMLLYNEVEDEGMEQSLL